MGEPKNDPPKGDPPKNYPPKPPPATGDDVGSLRAALKKANKDAERHRRRVEELEGAGRSELENAIAARDRAVQERDDAQRQLTRARIARSHGLADEDMEFVSGSTEDEIEESAKKLAGRILRNATDEGGEGGGGGQGGGQGGSGGGGKPPASDKPKENLSGGGDPNEPPDETDPAKLAAAIPRTF